MAVKQGVGIVLIHIAFPLIGVLGITELSQLFLTTSLILVPPFLIGTSLRAVWAHGGFSTFARAQWLFFASVFACICAIGVDTGLTHGVHAGLVTKVQPVVVYVF